MIKSAFVIVNPVAGQPEPVLSTLNLAFEDLKWKVAVTRPDVPMQTLVDEIPAHEFDAVFAYGGDGTIGAVASAMRDRKEPLGVLPGGTGNVIARTLGVPDDLERAARSLVSGVRKKVDVLEHGSQWSLLRLGYGADAATVLGASREAKDDLGWLAYLQSAAASMFESSPIEFQFQIDDEPHEILGVALSVANIGRIGRTDLHIHPGIEPDDGRLDVVIAQNVTSPFVDLASRLVPTRSHETPEDRTDTAGLIHLTGRKFRWLSHPAGRCHADGDELTDRVESVVCLEGVLEVLVPSR